MRPPHRFRRQFALLARSRGPGGEAMPFARLVLLGSLPRDRMAEHYARASAFISIARYEPFGLAVLEAARARCALVLSDIASFRELWDGAALFVGVDDVAGLAEILRSLIKSPQRCRAIAELAFPEVGEFHIGRNGARNLGGAPRVRGSHRRTGGAAMRIVSFNHSLASCWNHGNAHFLRGVLRELQARGHAIRSFEPSDGWSRMNLERAEPFAGDAGFRRDFPDLADAADFIHDDLDFDAGRRGPGAGA